MTNRIGSSVRSAFSAAITVVLLAGVLLPTGLIMAGTGNELFITEYVEGSGTNQAIELYNPTDNPVSLGASGYMLAFYLDGDTTIDSGVPLAGTIQPGATWVVTPTDAGAALLAIANQKFGNLWFDGNDAVALLHAGTAVDIIGQVGFDPGAGWGTGATSTADHTLRRKASVTAGDTNGGDAFDPSVEWTGYDIDTFSGLGNVSERVANEPVAITCPAPMSTTEGMAVSAPFSASDPDGVVASLTVNAVATTDPGTFSVANVVPAFAAGGTATGALVASSATPAGTYTVTLAATNQDATPQSATCDVAVTVDQAPPPPPPSLDTLHELIDRLVAEGAVNATKAPLLYDRLARAVADQDARRTDAYVAQLQALVNQAEGLAPRWVTPDAAAAIQSLAEEIASG